MDDTILKMVAEFGASGLMFLALFYVLRHATEQAKVERESHEKEVTRVLDTHERAMGEIAASVRSLSSDVCELRDDVRNRGAHVRGVSGA